MRGVLVAMMALMVCGAAAGGAAKPTPGASQPDPFSDNACVRCHRDLPGRLSQIVDLEWKFSVHYAAGVGCDGCHGGNPALRREQFKSDDAWKVASHLDGNPEFLLMHEAKEFVSAARGRSVSYFCGKCHAKIKEQHLGSPHGEFGDPTCLFCHGQRSHKITHATPDIIDTRGRSENGRCSPCHQSATMKAVARIKSILVDTEQQIKASGESYKELEAWGYRNLELEKLHHHTAGVRSQLRQVFHSFNMREINNFASEIQGTVDRTVATHELVQRLRKTQREQTLVGVCAVAVLLTFGGLLVYYKKAFLEHVARG